MFQLSIALCDETLQSLLELEDPVIAEIERLFDFTPYLEQSSRSDLAADPSSVAWFMFKIEPLAHTCLSNYHECALIFK